MNNIWRIYANVCEHHGGDQISLNLNNQKKKNLGYAEKESEKSEKVMGG